MSRKKVVYLKFEDVFLRLIKKTSIKNIVQLADFLEISQSAVSQKKKENNFPLEWAYKVTKEFNLSFDWLADEKVNQGNSETAQQARSNDLLNEIDIWLEEKAKRKPEIKDWFKYEFSKNFPEFEEWKRKVDREREASLAQQQKIA